ncbi:MAG: glutamate--tRNA ligase [Saccharofermentanales bacterium]
MSDKKVRTRFAPSPTGFMHVGNLRTALYEYLIARSLGGSFILRIEDTDQGRLIDGSVEVIYKTLRDVGLTHDEGPDIGGDYGPYVQSLRKDIYKTYAEALAADGKAYYCFCTKERLDSLRADHPDDENGSFLAGYDRHCRNLGIAEVRSAIDSCIPYVIRQKMPLAGSTTFDDAVFGSITVDNTELEDQILLKSDGFPTYNFANVVDDHLMNITHVVRGSEYLSSTPKYNLLYEAFGWEIPVYVHLPLIMGKNEDGSVAKLSKRHGSTGYEDLKNDGYLKEAILNYIALLGWCPKDNIELMDMDGLVTRFSIDGISKSPAVFDYEKLRWFNAEYIKKMAPEDFFALIRTDLETVDRTGALNLAKIAELLQTRISQLNEVPGMVRFFDQLPEYSVDLYVHQKMKSSLVTSLDYMAEALPLIEALQDWTAEGIHDLLIGFASSHGIKNGQIMWPIRTALSGQPGSPGGAVELLFVFGREESVSRIRRGLQILQQAVSENRQAGQI